MSSNLEPCSYCGGEADPSSTCPRAVECPTCGAGAGSPCRRPSGHRAASLHVSRISVAEELDRRAFGDALGAFACDPDESGGLAGELLERAVTAELEGLAEAETGELAELELEHAGASYEQYLRERYGLDDAELEELAEIAARDARRRAGGAS